MKGAAAMVKKLIGASNVKWIVFMGQPTFLSRDFTPSAANSPSRAAPDNFDHDSQHQEQGTNEPGRALRIPGRSSYIVFHGSLILRLLVLVSFGEADRAHLKNSSTIPTAMKISPKVSHSLFFLSLVWRA